MAPPNQKTLWFGILYLFPTVGIAGGYIFGGVIGASMGWRMPFLIQVSLFLQHLVRHQAKSLRLLPFTTPGVRCIQIASASIWWCLALGIFLQFNTIKKISHTVIDYCHSYIAVMWCSPTTPSLLVACTIKCRPHKAAQPAASRSSCHACRICKLVQS